MLDILNSLMLLDPFSDSSIINALRPLGLKDIQTAKNILQNFGKKTSLRSHLVEMMPYLVMIMASTGNPDRVIASLDRFLKNAQDAAQILAFFSKNPRQLEVIARAFAGSQFLTEIILQNPEYVDEISSINEFSSLKSPEQFISEAQNSVSTNPDIHFHIALRRYQRQELLRIGIADLLGMVDLPAVTAQLSNLADSLVEVCLQWIAGQLGLAHDHFVVFGLGKLGGCELNYSSDIDLLFIARDDPSRFVRLSEKLIDAVSSITEEGFLYRVDMRLRPWGSVGSLVSSLDGYTKYLLKHARLWEKQALLKARPIAGDKKLGQDFLDNITDLMFSATVEEVRSSVMGMKLRTENVLRLQGKESGEVKLGQGSIRDIEFVVQYLQLAFGKKNPLIRNRNTLESIALLQNEGFLLSDDTRVLADGYIFLRAIEHYLQLNEYRQTHQLPVQPDELDNLARRLGFTSNQASSDLMSQYIQHSAAIRSVFLRYVGNNAMNEKDTSIKQQQENQTPFTRHVQRMDPSYSETFSQEEIQHHAEMAECLDLDHLVAIDAKQMEDGRWRVTIVAYDYLGELSLICGLMFVYGLNILGGEVFTYEATAPDKDQFGFEKENSRKKIVDVFTVQPEKTDFTLSVWDHYTEDLAALLKLMDSGQRRNARGILAKRVATVLQETNINLAPLYPIEIAIDNEQSDQYTLLLIDSIDTIGFLYELTNALAYSQIYIARVSIDSTGSRVRDTLFVSDDKGQKITDENRLRELRAAIVLIKHFTHLLPHSPNPESALLHFRDFIAQLFERPNWPDELTSLEQPEVLHGIARLLGVSDFLWDDFLRLQYANLFPVVKDVDALDSIKSRQQLQAELGSGLRPIHSGPQPFREDAPWIKYLNEFKDREMFRIDMRHILGHTKEFWEFSFELTDLTEVIVNTAYHLAAEDLRTTYGSPYLEDGRISQMAVVALGKCGGRELGFASDIELMFIYEGNGLTSGNEKISSTEFHEKTVQAFIRSIYARREGIFEIDLQLRPYGKAGSLAVSLEAFKRYFSPGGSAWAYERQALVKLRPIAGDENLGSIISGLRDEFIYSGQPFDVIAMRAMRERQLRHLVTAGKFHPKFSPGGLVDIEYLVQALQIIHGVKYASVRNTNTRDALKALYETGIINDDDYTNLRRAHTFLRWLIDSLRVVRGNAKDVQLPQVDSEEFAFLSRRLRFGADTPRLKENITNYTANVYEINHRLLEGLG